MVHTEDLVQRSHAPDALAAQRRSSAHRGTTGTEQTGTDGDAGGAGETAASGVGGLS